MATVSLLLTASRDEASVRSLLELIRPAVDEVVVGVDARAAERILGACGELVDQAYSYEFDASVEQYTPWLHERCTSDWTLRVDDDEVPSPALIEALDEITSSRRPMAILVPVRHLFPNRERYITSHPWHPEYQPRLTRNLPGIQAFRGTNHARVDVLGERRRVPEIPLYHLHFAVPDTEARLATARRRERATPGIMTEGYNVNEVSLPELWNGVETAPVPSGDRPSIERVAAPAPVAPAAAPVAYEPIPREAAQRLLMGRTVPADAYRAEIEISTARRAVAAGMTAHIEVHVHNRGSEHWPPAHQPEPLIRLAYRLLSADGKTTIEPEGLRTPFEETVLPGQRAVVMLAVAVPEQPGRYLLEVDVVHELVSWFRCEARMELFVEPLEGPALEGSPSFARPDHRSIGLHAADAAPADGRDRRSKRFFGALRAPRRSREPSG
jgi:hypothetical protein